MARRKLILDVDTGTDEDIQREENIDIELSPAKS